MKYGLLSLGLVFFLHHSAHAFGLSEHEDLTRLAFRVLKVCTPQARVHKYKDQIIETNHDEDTHLLRKWTRYSHYYNPRKNLKTSWRVTADVRVSEIEEELIQGAPAEELGVAIHMIQDMASPPHVVPVVHGLDDKFESWEGARMDVMDYFKSANVTCSDFELTSSESLRGIFEDTAISTFDSLKERFDAVIMKRKRKISWAWFWESGKGREFGHYGLLGNRFGQPEFEFGGVEYSVRFDIYSQFRKARVIDAVTGTIGALLWWESLQ